MTEAAATAVTIRERGLERMTVTWKAMKEFTDRRGADDQDEVWFVEHQPVFTLGLAGDAAHVLDAGDIEVVQTDRGGQVTYHGPGQLVCYVMLDLRRRGLHIRSLVELLEATVIETIAVFGVDGYARRDAPGVYVDGKKLAAIGLRVRRGCSYHGIALNVAMDLAPYARINPCGFEGLEVTQLRELSAVTKIADVRPVFERALLSRLDE